MVRVFVQLKELDNDLQQALVKHFPASTFFPCKDD